MNTKVHYVIVKAATQLLGDMAMDLLRQPIDQNKWSSIKNEFGINSDNDGGLKQETFLDLVMLGAYLEDKPKISSGITEPVIRDKLVKAAFEAAEPGKYQHWMEHFWNDSLDINKGLVIDIDYICDLIAEALGGRFWGEYFSEIRSEVYEIIAAPITALCKGGTTVLDEFRSAPARAQEYWDVLINQYKSGEKERAYLNLGRVCHLLADVGTPAHLHGDPHAGFYPVAFLLKKIGLDGLIDTKDGTGVDDDQYEYYTGLVIEENLSEIIKENRTDFEKALPTRWNVISDDVASYKSSWKMIDYFKQLGTMTRNYDSDDVDGARTGHPYHYEHFNPFDLYTYKLERQWDGDLRNSACADIASDLIPATISYTAGLIMHFYDTVDEKTETTEVGSAQLSVKATNMYVIDDTDPCGKGEIYLDAGINGQNWPQGRIKASTGENVNLANRNICWDKFLMPKQEINLNIKSHAYDNDDIDLWFTKIRDSESLGYIDKNINTKDIPENTHYLLTVGSKNPHYYDLTFDFFKKVQRKKIVTRVNDAWLKRYKNRQQFISVKAHTFSTGFSPITLYLNLEDQTLHLNNKKNQCCGHFERKKAINKNDKIELTLNKKEIFETDIDKLFKTDSCKDSFKQSALNSLAKLKKLAKKRDNKKLSRIAEDIEKCQNYKILFVEEGSLLSRIMKVKYPQFSEKYGEITEDNFEDVFSTKCMCCSDERVFWTQKKEVKKKK